jgi:uncharacterized delta-60 repeat protein
VLGLAAFFWQSRGALPSLPAGLPWASVAAAPASPLVPEPAVTPRRVQPVGAPADAKAELPAVFAQFGEWAGRYLAQPAATRDALVAEGRELAAARRAELAKLIRSDPRAALAEAVPMVVRQQLPAEIVALLEDRVAGRGELAFNGVTPPPGEPVREAAFRSAMVGDQEYRAHVFGRRELPGTVGKTSMNGIALDGHFAVAESPLRVLEAGEMAAGRPLNEICDVSGQATATAADAPLNAGGVATAVEYDGAIHILCGPNHVAATESRLLAREQDNVENAAAGGPGSSGVSGRPSISWAQGPKKLLIIRVDFSDNAGTPVSASGAPMTETYVADITRHVQDFYAANSFGKTSLLLGAAVNGDSPDVTPVLRMPQPATYYDARMDGLERSGFLHQDARNAAVNAGFNVSGYDRVGVVFSNLNYWWAGLGNINGPNFWINAYYDLRVVAHEIGHNYGLMHSNFWQTPYPYDQPLTSSGSSVEYGDAMDVMGSGGGLDYHFSHWNKSILQWIPDTAVTTVETNGTYRVHQLDAGGANLALPRALKLRFDQNRDYWIGFRGNMPLGTAANGAYVLWGYNTNTQGNLLNVSRRSSGSTYDAPLPVGESFTDTVNGVTMRNVAQGGSGADRWIDVQFTFQPAVRWSQTAEYIAGEHEGSARLRVQRYGDFASALTINYATSGGAPENGRATGGQDYVETTGSLTWAAGESADKFITIPVIGDSLWEAGERFTVTLSATATGMVSGNPAATVAILDTGIRDFGFVADTPWGRVFSAVVQSDGSMIVGGPFQEVYDQHWQPHARRGLAKLSADGRLQPDFASGVGGGEATVRDLALQADGRIIVAGSFQFVGDTSRQNIARLNANGTLDTGFTASANGPVWAVLVQPDGRVLLGGSFTSVNGVPREHVARLNADGSLDASFVGPDFESPNQVVKSLALQPDSRVLVGGVFILPQGGLLRSSLCRLMASGALDTSFVVAEGAHQIGNPNLNGDVRAIVVQPDGRILIGGDFSAYNNTARGGIARLNTSGSVDTSFTVSTNGRCNALLPLPDGRLLLGGWFTQVNGTAAKNIAMVSASGALDTNMAGAGGYDGELYDFQLLANGRVQFTGDMTSFQFSSEGRTIWRMITGLAESADSVQFATTTAIGAEGNNVTLTVSRTGGRSGAISVGYAASAGTATAADHGPATGTLTWASDDTAAKAITIALTNDGLSEPAETFTVNLSSPAGGATLGAATQATVTIQGDGPPPDPTDWQSGDVGVVGAAGSSSESNGVVTLTGSGDDIWNTADAFHFRSQTLTGDGAIVARVVSMGNTHPWAKVGLMFRESLTAGSREVMAFMSPGNNSGLQYRLETGGQSAMGANFWSGFPVWLMLVRSGDSFGAYRSYDGENWTSLGTINCNLPDTAHIGLAISSHVRGTIVQATLDNVEIIGAEPPGEPPAAPTNLQATGATASTVSLTWTDNASDETGFAIERAPGSTTTFAEVGTVAANVTSFTNSGLTANTTYTYRVRARRDSLYSNYSNTALITTTSTPPSGWQSLDIGNVGLSGSATIADPNIAISAAGADMWGPADGFHYVYQRWSGDGEIIARVARLDNTHGWAKAGVMFRESLNANSANVAYVVTAGANSGLQVRSSAGAETTFTNGPWVNAPYWVRLVRTGNVFTAYTSPDGVSWSQQASVTIPMAADIHVGVAASSHNTGVRTTAAFESVELPGNQPPPPPPSEWTQTSLGGGSGSFTTPSATSMTINAVGADIWGQGDSGHYVYQEWDGDGPVVVRVNSLTNTHPWAKAGIMLREDLSAGSRNVFLGITPGAGAVSQIRGTTGGVTEQINQSWLPGVPCWLRLTRSGENILFEFSTDGTSWTVLSAIGVAKIHRYVGLAVSSHAQAATTAVFTDMELPGSPPPPSHWEQATWGTATTGSFTSTGLPGGGAPETVSLDGTGADIWGQSDAGLYVYRDWRGVGGGGVVTVRVESMTNTHPWAKAGIMFRESLDAAAPNVFLALTPSAGVILQVRSASGSPTTEARHSWTPGVPCWLRLTRGTNRTFVAEFSSDGANWTVLGTISDPLTQDEVYSGVAASSHSTSSMAVHFSMVEMLWAI